MKHCWLVAWAWAWANCRPKRSHRFPTVRRNWGIRGNWGILEKKVSAFLLLTKSIQDSLTFVRLLMFKSSGVKEPRHEMHCPPNSTNSGFAAGTSRMFSWARFYFGLWWHILLVCIIHSTGVWSWWNWFQRISRSQPFSFNIRGKTADISRRQSDRFIYTI